MDLGLTGSRALGLTGLPDRDPRGRIWGFEPVPC